MTSPVRAARPAPRRAAAPVAAPERRRGPDLFVVGAPRRRPRTAAILGGVAIALFGSLLASAVLYSMLVSGQAHLDHLDKQIQTEQVNLQRAKLALADSQSPTRIVREAHRLGMVPAPQQTWVSLDGHSAPVTTGTEPSTSTTVPTSTTTSATSTGSTSTSSSSSSSSSSSGSTTSSTAGVAR